MKKGCASTQLQRQLRPSLCLKLMIINKLVMLQPRPCFDYYVVAVWIFSLEKKMNPTNPRSESLDIKIFIKNEIDEYFEKYNTKIATKISLILKENAV